MTTKQIIGFSMLLLPILGCIGHYITKDLSLLGSLIAWLLFIFAMVYGLFAFHLIGLDLM